MNRIEFYTKLNKAKDEVRKKQLEHSSTQNNYNSWFIKVDDYYGINQPRYFTKEEFDELRHSNEYGKQHYAKIENYYGPGKTRYFWSKEEWDAYQREKEKMYEKAKADVAKRDAENKSKEHTHTSSGRYFGNNSSATSAPTPTPASTNISTKQDSFNNKTNVDRVRSGSGRTFNDTPSKLSTNSSKFNSREDIERKANTANVNANASEEEIKRNIEKAKKKNEASENEYEKQKWDALKKQNNPEPKFVSTAETREEAEIEARNKTVENNRKEKLEKDFENWKKEGEKNILPSRKKLNKYTEELTKLQGQMNLIQNRKFSQEGDKQKYNELKKAINEKEQQIEKAKESLAKEREANYKKNMASQEKAMKEGQKTTIEENKKLRESIEKQKAEELERWKDERYDEVRTAKKQIENAIEACYKDRHTSFNINNEYTDLLKELLSKADPDFEDKYEGSIAKYVMPSFEATGWMKEHDMDPFRNDERKKIVDETLEGLHKMIVNSIESTTVEDEKYDSYLNKLKKAKKEKTDKAITKDISNARLSLKKMYDGDSKNLDLDPSLMKALNDKLAQMDEEYNGNLYKYVRPYLFNTWIKDDDSYDTVKKALDEIEKELRTANKNNEDYGEYIDKVSKILEA